MGIVAGNVLAVMLAHIERVQVMSSHVYNVQKCSGDWVGDVPQLPDSPPKLANVVDAVAISEGGA